MANRAQKGKLTVDFHAEKLKMLAYCMAEKDMDLEQVVADFIDGLYEKHVPKIMKGFVKSDPEAPKKAERNCENLSNEVLVQNTYGENQ